MPTKPYRSALVLGLGASGVAAAELLLGEGTAVAAVDSLDTAELAAAAEKLRARGAVVRLGVDLPQVERHEVCVISPGISADSDWARPVRQSGVALISELELGASRCRWPLLAVTGSNGKSTLVKLCGDALRAAGRSVALGGNYGTPLCALVAGPDHYDWIVTEVSSFQLEHTRHFAPRIGVLLNVQPNHLNRHADMETYVGLKARLFENQGRSETAIVPADWRNRIRGRTSGCPRWVTFGSEPEADYRCADGRVDCRAAGEPAPALSLAGTLFDNEVMGVTAAAAWGAVQAAGVPVACLAQALKEFEPLPHRMQTVSEIRNVQFVDDSKATNLAAMEGALRMAKRPVRLIAGGILKESEVEWTTEMLARTVKSVYLIGESCEKLGKAWGDVVRCVACGGLEEATRRAWQDAAPGDMVLLSPACASFDQFKNYEDRGHQFQRVVESLKGEVR
jgi:UDP-N-acetylmuramoylalanine--D-glutamate ligase